MSVAPDGRQIHNIEGKDDYNRVSAAIISGRSFTLIAFVAGCACIFICK